MKSNEKSKHNHKYKIRTGEKIVAGESCQQILEAENLDKYEISETRIRKLLVFREKKVQGHRRVKKQTF